MLLNNLRIAYRTLLKNRAFSFINIFGLGVGIASFLLIVQYIRYEQSYEDSNVHVDDIYRITLEMFKGAEIDATDCETHPGMGPMMKDKFPEVLEFARMYNVDNLKTIKSGTETFLEDKLYFADPGIFKIFTYTFIAGDEKTALNAPFEAVVTESMAKKYFGRTDVVDETIDLENHLYRIKGVIADVPPNTHLKFNMLLSRLSFQTLRPWYTDDNWSSNNEYTYMLMTPGLDLTSFNKKLSALCVEMKDKLYDSRYVAEPVKDIHLYSNKSYEPEANGSARIVGYLVAIAAFIIVIAWINYINLSTARAMERAREVGIRKVMGSLKAQLIVQFLSESVVINALAAILGLILFQVGMPLFRQLTGQPLTLGIPTDAAFWTLFSLLVFAGSLLSGIYPAFVLASFSPVAVLKGKFRSSSHGQLLRKGLIVFQFGAAVILMICMGTVYQQVRHLQHYDLGMNIEQTLAISAPQLKAQDSLRRKTFESLSTELLRNPEILNIARAETLPGSSIQEVNTTTISKAGQDQSSGIFDYFQIDAGFIPTLNMKLSAGRNFEAGVPNQDQVIVNEQAIKRLGFSSPEEAVGSKITFRTRGDASASTIIGVLKNFYHRSPKEEHLPMIFYYGENPQYFALRLNTTHTAETLASIRSTWDKVYPGTVFNYFFIDDKYNQQYQADAQFGRVMATFSGLLIFVACLGLFGLSSYTIIQRTKEIGIRKVLGASVAQIVSLLSRDFAKVIMIAAVCALPLAYLIMKRWLDTYAVRIELSAGLFIIPIVLILLLAFVTVSFQTIRTALSNPTDSLKQE